MAGLQSRSLVERNCWPLALVVLGLFFMLLTVWSVRRAACRGAAVLERDYYHQGLTYDHLRQQEEDAAVRGWRLSAVRTRAGEFEATLTGARHEPITGCSGELTVFEGRLPSHLQLSETAPGRYGAVLPGQRHDKARVAVLQLQKDGLMLRQRLYLAVTP